MVELVVIRAYYDSVPNIQETRRKMDYLKQRDGRYKKDKNKTSRDENYNVEIKKNSCTAVKKPIAIVLFNGQKPNAPSLPPETTSETRQGWLLSSLFKLFFWGFCPVQ